jgi:hypothetical protein
MCMRPFEIVCANGGKREAGQQRSFRVMEMDTLPRTLKRNRTSLSWQRYSQSASRQRARASIRICNRLPRDRNRMGSGREQKVSGFEGSPSDVRFGSFSTKPVNPALVRANDAAVQMIDTSIVRIHQHGVCITRNRRQSNPRDARGPRSTPWWRRRVATRRRSPWRCAGPSCRRRPAHRYCRRLRRRWWPRPCGRH